MVFRNPDQCDTGVPTEKAQTAAATLRDESRVNHNAQHRSYSSLNIIECYGAFEEDIIPSWLFDIYKASLRLHYIP